MFPDADGWLHRGLVRRRTHYPHVGRVLMGAGPVPGSRTRAGGYIEDRSDLWFRKVSLWTTNRSFSHFTGLRDG